MKIKKQILYKYKKKNYFHFLINFFRKLIHIFLNIDEHKMVLGVLMDNDDNEKYFEKNRPS